MIDIHSHILPGFDDGVRTMEETLELLRTEHQGGTRQIFATPHVIEMRDYERVCQIAERVDAVRRELAAHDVGVEVLVGGEVYPTTAMLTALDQRLPITMGGRGKHMLMDLPLMSLPHDFDELVYEVHLRGVTPIIAHPERAATFQNAPDRLLEYLEKGAACQVNAGSLAGKYGPRAAEVGHYYLERQWPSFVASDAHRPGRKPILGTCVAYLRAEFGSDYIDFITETWPGCVRDGLDLPARAYLPPKRAESWLSRVFNRRRK